jgi:8-oxo-dGTP pyrophosphatase MutT (NUDIX family)
VFQTVDLGSGQSRYIEKTANRHPYRAYAAVDHKYDTHLFPGYTAYHTHANIVAAHPNVTVSAKTIQAQLAEMKQKGIRTRHFTLDFPPRIRNNKKPPYLVALFRLAPQVLFPNGKIFVSTEDAPTRDAIRELAEKTGLRVRDKPPLRGNEKDRHTPFTPTNAPSHRLEITYGLKKAFPNQGRKGDVKKQRRDWPPTPPARTARPSAPHP